MTDFPKCPGRIASRPTGFTLVELLVTVSIIAILAGIVLGALSATRKTAKIAKTKATIVKLDRIIMKKYNSYLSRRIPVDTTGMDPKNAAYLRYQALHDLMRLEMPDRSTDIKGDLVQKVPARMKIDGTTYRIDRPAMSKCYLVDYNNSPPSLEWLQAECLYMIIATGDATALADFSETEMGDYDEDGWQEFHDAWGMPIGFLRWAPKFLPPNTDLQSDEKLNPSDSLSDFCYPNPFDPLRIDGVSAGSSGGRRGSGGSAASGPISYKLVPLIYSMGPDKGGDSADPQYGIDPGAFKFDGSPFKTLNSSGGINNAGAIVGGGITHDNITNHRIEAR